jgi:uncharacterized Actinobacterial protein TIGR03083
MSGYQVRSADVDAGSLYETIRARFIALVRDLNADELDRSVVATPEWRVRDVLAHVAGLTEDLNAGNFGGGDPDAFTRAQVDRHRGSTLDDVIRAWDRDAPAFEDGLRLFGYQAGNHFVGDLFIHFVDVCASAGRAVDRDSEAMWVSLDWYLDSLEEAIEELSLGALEVVTEPERRIIGRGDVLATVTAEPFEILRACAGRRSTAQVCAFAWTGDAGRFLPHISRYSFPAADLPD